MNQEERQQPLKEKKKMFKFYKQWRNEYKGHTNTFDYVNLMIGNFPLFTIRKYEFGLHDPEIITVYNIGVLGFTYTTNKTHRNQCVDKLGRLMAEYPTWSDATFGGPELRDHRGALLHLKLEIDELIENPNDTSEWADCVLLLLDAARRKGHSPDDLFEFAYQKFQKNKKRTWTQNVDGVFLHNK